MNKYQLQDLENKIFSLLKEVDKLKDVVEAVYDDILLVQHEKLEEKTRVLELLKEVK